MDTQSNVSEVAAREKWQEILVALFRIRVQRSLASGTSTRFASSFYEPVPAKIYIRSELRKHLFPVSFVPRGTVAPLTAERSTSPGRSSTLELFLVQHEVEWLVFPSFIV